MASAPSTPKRKRSTLLSGLSDALLHPGWRSKRARSGSRSGSPTNSGASTPGVGESETYIIPQSSIHPDSVSPDGAAERVPYHVSEHEIQGSEPLVPEIVLQGDPEVSMESTSAQSPNDAPWAALERALKALHITTQACPPLHSAVDGFKSCLDVFKEASKSRKDYDELATGLTAIVELLDKHLQVSASREITEAIKSIADDLAKELKAIENRTSASGSRRVLGPSGDEEDLIRRYYRIEHIFRRLQAEASMSTWDSVKRQEVVGSRINSIRSTLMPYVKESRLEKLGPVMLATYNSKLSMDVGRRSCTEDTRIQVLKDLMAWAGNSDGAKIYWMNGMAGTGKTTIAYSLCEQLEAGQQLAASFFCTRMSRECNEAKQIIPTIAYQLARYSAPFRDALCRILNQNPDIGALNTNSQFCFLLAKPLGEVRKVVGRNLVIVIDALDECSDPYAVKVMLDMLLPFATDSPIKFFVTSRPEPAIRESMMVGIDQCNHPRSILYLHEIEKSLVRADIELYLKDELKHMLPAHQSGIVALAEKAGNLFIYAATAVRYIQAAGKAFNSKRLKSILGVNSKSKNGLSAIDALYQAILIAAIHDNPLEPDERDIILTVLWTAVCACEPVLIDTLAALCNLDETDLVMSALQPLRSVLHVSEHDRLVTTLHASFPDFMFSRERSQDFFCDRLSHDRLLAEHCLGIMKAQLRFNICKIESSQYCDPKGFSRKRKVEKNISRELLYACRFWVDHLVRATPSQSLITVVHDFLLHRLLFWMEVMNVTLHMQNGAIALVSVPTWLQSANAATDAIALAHDAQVFVGRYAAERDLCARTPHIYISALAFYPPSSLISQTYRPRFIGLVKATGTLMDKINRGSLAVWSPHGNFMSASFSADGRYIVIGDDGGGICVYQAHDGREIISFQTHQGLVESVSLSSDGNLIGSSSKKDHALCIWNVSDGSLVSGPLKGHTEEVYSNMLSPDGARLVSGSEDCTIRIWVISEPSPFHLLLTGHTAPVNSVTFSPDGTQIASGSRDRTIRLWDAASGIFRYCLSGHTASVTCVRFSPCGSFVVSGSGDNTVRIWDPRNGAPIGSSFDGHSDTIACLSVSPDGERIASCDHEIQVWDRTSRKLVYGPFRLDVVTSIQFSADGARLMSASYPGCIQMLDLRERAWHDELKDSTSHGRSMKMSTISPGGAYIASGNSDGTIGIWNLQSARLERVFASRSDLYERIVELSFSSNGVHIFVVHDDGVLETFNIHTGELVGDPHSFSPHGRIAHRPFALSSNAQSVVSAGVHNNGVGLTLDLWDIESSQLISTIDITNEDDRFTNAVFSPDGNRIATSTHKGCIDVWDSGCGQRLTSLILPGARCTLDDSESYMAISPNGSLIFCMSNDGYPWVCNLIDGTFTVLPFDDGWRVSGGHVKFSPNGDLIALGTRNWWGRQHVVLYNTLGVTRKHSGLDLPSGFSGIIGLEFVGDESCLVSFVYNGQLRVLRHQVHRYLRLLGPDSDGVTVDDEGDCMIIIPLEIRNELPLSNGMSLTEHGSIVVDYDNLLIGAKWSQCYLGDS
ncbi:unnamed protein product [Rhizoctonia solani]|uniref:NACHT domain-containing protein n=1 Tax=Rhizoctonia solani TaxID=456999 RepID=A0A8H3CNP3_9AGAM|nr:unnamed protein product [Rhizoctonia solani]